MAMMPVTGDGGAAFGAGAETAVSQTTDTIQRLMFFKGSPLVADEMIVYTTKPPVKQKKSGPFLARS